MNFPTLSGNIGHASLRVTEGYPAGEWYFSRWPGSLVSTFLVGAGTINTWEDDVRSEGGYPTAVTLAHLNETAIKGAMLALNKVQAYGSLALNCATQVKMCLDQGVPVNTDLLDVGLDEISAGKVIPETPWGVYRHALTLSFVY